MVDQNCARISSLFSRQNVMETDNDVFLTNFTFFQLFSVSIFTLKKKKNNLNFYSFFGASPAALRPRLPKTTLNRREDDLSRKFFFER